MMNEDWQLLTTFFPSNWQEQAIHTNAVKGLRKDKPIENLLHVILIHVGCGYSLRETVVRAHKAGLAEMTDVALLKRLRKCKDWLHSLCVSLFTEFGILGNNIPNLRFRLFDVTHVKEPGKTGSQWRIHYSFQVPDMRCDFFKVTKTTGENVAEDFLQFPIRKGDYIIADRGYSRAPGIAYVTDKGAFICVRVNYQSIALMQPGKQKKFLLLKKLKKVIKPLEVCSWPVEMLTAEGRKILGRLCIIRKTEKAIEAHKKLKRRANKKGNKLKEETLFLSEYVILFTTFPREHFSAEKILEWYRIRWQIELVFKRFKQIVHMGHVPKYHDESAQAWLYGKLFTALITEKIMQYAKSISPWGYSLGTHSHQ